MKISGLQKMSLLDYPDHISAIIFTQGCNFRCPYCQNSSLLDNREALLNTEEVLDYLKMRKKLLDGVTITGGEPTMQEDLEEFIDKIKRLRLDVKLDTNGTNPQLLKRLIEKKKLDYIAMDIKNSFVKYANTVGVTKDRIKDIKESIDIIKNSSIEHEFRTTVTKELHSVQDLKEIATLTKGSKYFIQNYEDYEEVLVKGQQGFSEDELNQIKKELITYNPLVRVRGLDE